MRINKLFRQWKRKIFEIGLSPLEIEIYRIKEARKRYRNIIEYIHNTTECDGCDYWWGNRGCSDCRKYWHYWEKLVNSQAIFEKLKKKLKELEK